MSAYGIPPGDCDIVERAKVTKAIVLVWPCMMWEPCSSQGGTQRVSPGYVDLLGLDCTHCIIVVVTKVLVITFSLLLVYVIPAATMLSSPTNWNYDVRLISWILINCIGPRLSDLQV